MQTLFDVALGGKQDLKKAGDSCGDVKQSWRVAAPSAPGDEVLLWNY